MRSAELARLAGVSVRALRHYHHLGVLPEPARGLNGYREYTVRDLIRLLRLRHLQAAGFSLEAAGAMLDLGPEAPDDLFRVLDEVDQDLERKIDELTRQRTLLAQARAAGTAPDLPAHLLRFAPLLITASPELAASSREQLTYLAHLEGLTGTTAVEALLERMSNPEALEQLLALGERLEQLPDEEAAIQSLTDDLLAFFASGAGAALTEPIADTVDDRWTEPIAAYTRETLTPAQAEVFARMEKQLND